MSSLSSRACVRYLNTTSTSRAALRRHASTTSEAAQSTASSTLSKAQSATSSGLSKVQASAGPALKNAGSRISSALGRVGGRTGRLIKFIESLIPPTIYYARVGAELSKLVFQGQKMTPPSVATFQQYLTPVVQSLRHPSNLLKYSPNTLYERTRGMSRQQAIAMGVVGAEVLGFFTVGTMIGRMKIIGYRGEKLGEHH